ncbi:MAG: glycosyltransferase family 4 protein [Lentisphaeria bacterium]|nr:glycosyltransferase family 4 protein [Lentisphaeria bacterium]
MKICHVITRMIIGGAQENTLLSIKGALEKGHDVTLITGPTEGPEGKLLRDQPMPGLKIIECPWLVREISPWKEWKAYLFLKKICRQEKFDVVHTHTSKAGILGRIAGRHAGVPLVVHTIHGLAFHPYQSAMKNRLYIFLEKLAAKYCDEIYCVAQAMIDQSLAVGIGKKEMFKVVYSGMHIETFLNAVPDPELKNELGLPEHAVVFSTVARLFPEKGYEDFIPVAIRIAKKYPQACFLLIGNGILMDSIRKDVEEAGVAEHFFFPGLVSPGEVHRYLALSNALVHLSLHEGLPRAAVQSLGCGNPVIGYNLDGTPEVVRNGETGWLIQPRNLDDVEQAMIQVIEHPELAEQYGENGRKLVGSLFGWQKMADALLELYSAALAGKKSQ